MEKFNPVDHPHRRYNRQRTILTASFVLETPALPVTKTPTIKALTCSPMTLPR